MNETTELKLQQALNSKGAIKNAIEAKGVSVGDASFDEYAGKIEQISGGLQEAPENDVNFYDYDGFRVASYTIEEAKALTELPTPPSHDGLTFQEWNWTLADIQSYNRQYADIGANYITTDGKTHYKIKVIGNSQVVNMSFNGTAGTLTIDWGDESATDNHVMNGTAYTFTHTYTNGGDYEVKLSFVQSSNSDVYGAINTYASASWSKNFVLKEVNVGSYFSLDYIYPFCYFPDGFVISIASTTPCYLNRGFQNANCMQVNLPKVFEKANYQPFSQFQGKISFPKSVTAVGSITMGNCFIPRIVFPTCSDATNTISAFTFNSLPLMSVVSLPDLGFNARTQADYFASSSNLGVIDIVNGWTPNNSIRFDYNTRMEAENIVAFFNKLGTTTGSITLTFGTTNLNKLTAEEKAIATNKGYTLA